MAPPAFQIYPTDILRDVAAAGLSAAEGWYFMRLYLLCWEREVLPIDVERLANMAGAPLGVFRRAWPHMQPLFERTDEGWRHPELDAQRKSVTAFSEAQSKKGIASGEARRRRRFGQQPGGTVVQQPDEPGFEPIPATDTATEHPTETATEHATELQPDTNSSFFVLHTSVLKSSVSGDLPAREGEPLDQRFGHRSHVFCGLPDGHGGLIPARFCVPKYLHDEFERALGNHGDEFSLRTWYPDVARADTGDMAYPDLFAYWRGHFKALVAAKGWAKGAFGPPMQVTERQRLQDLKRRTWVGKWRCPHDLPCEDEGECSRLIVNGWRAKDGMGPLPP